MTFGQSFMGGLGETPKNATYGSIMGATDDYIKNINGGSSVLTDTLNGRNTTNNSLASAIDKEVKSGNSQKNKFAKQLMAKKVADDLNTALKEDNYIFTPSRVDFSQFMGLSPETQRYIYRGY